LKYPHMVTWHKGYAWRLRRGSRFARSGLRRKSWELRATRPRRMPDSRPPNAADDRDSGSQLTEPQVMRG
jgi:hypothetical protein